MSRPIYPFAPSSEPGRMGDLGFAETVQAKLEGKEHPGLLPPSSTTKPSNPKDAVGIRKVGLSVLPLRVLYEVALGLLEGALKYGRHNYRVKEIGVRASVYYDATNRHLDAWWEGQNIDPGSGLNHITKAISSLTVLRDAMLGDNWVDDRPPAVSDPNWIEEYNKQASNLLDKYPNPVQAFTEKAKSYSEHF